MASSMSLPMVGRLELPCSDVQQTTPNVRIQLTIKLLTHLILLLAVFVNRFTYLS